MKLSLTGFPRYFQEHGYLLSSSWLFAFLVVVSENSMQLVCYRQVNTRVNIKIMKGHVHVFMALLCNYQIITISNTF